jgi:hypothetical protein
MGILNLNHLILMIKNWHDDVCVGSNGAYKLLNMIDFLMLKSIIIETISSLESKAFLKKTLI